MRTTDTEVVILCGGRGSRLADLTHVVPKPLVTIGDRPIVDHIMAWYAAFGYSRFTLCLGYRADSFVRHYAADAPAGTDEDAVLHEVITADGWRVRLVDTGLDTQTGGRVRRIRHLLRDASYFMLTYGDALADVDLEALLAVHQRGAAIATVTLVHPAPRFGVIELEDPDDPTLVTSFREKPYDEKWVNGGFMVVDGRALTRLGCDSEVLETGLLQRLANERSLRGHRHEGYWQCMDTSHDRSILEDVWASGSAPWSFCAHSGRLRPQHPAPERQ